MRRLNFRKIPQINHQSGFSLVEMIVVVAIMGVISLGMASMIVDQNKQTQALQQKLGAIEIETQIKQALSSNEYCGCLMRGRTFNIGEKTFSSLPEQIPFGYVQPAPAAPTACTAIGTNIIQTAPGSNQTLRAESIQVQDVVQLGVGSFSAKFIIPIDSTSLIRSIKPISTSFTFNVDPTVPTAAPFLGCGTAISAVSAGSVTSGFADGFNEVSCPAGSIMTSCHIEVQSGDGSSNFYRNQIFYSPVEAPTRCYSSMTDGTDKYRLTALCVR